MVELGGGRCEGGMMWWGGGDDIDGRVVNSTAAEGRSSK